ncbi:MAG: translation initiation factor IF-2, partial [Coprobacillaceae bacterium]
MAKQTNKKRSTKKKQLQSNFPTKKEEVEVKDGVVVYEEGITVGELAEKVGQTPANVIKVLFLLGTMVTINSSLTDEQVELICLEYGFETEKHANVSEINFEEIEVIDNEEDLIARSPVVTIMGHVDHGKTTLLDTIRKSTVVDGEFGGITQHIGAYQVNVNGKKITFLDTPGHEAFTAMRARGAKVTDIVIIVVAADDGVMPQTKEAIDHAKAAGVPIVVAINKIDKEGADSDRIKSAMSEEGLMPEDWGGDTVYCEISAKQRLGIEELLETLVVVAEMSDLKANPNRYAYGSVIEGKLDKGRGPVATLLVENGTLRSGDPIVVGTSFGRVRQMLNDLGKVIKEAAPATPVEITGLNEVPVAGDKFMAFESEKMARSIGETRMKARQDKERRSNAALSLDDLFSQVKEGEIIDLNIIVKADVQGTAEAVKASLEKIDVDGVRVNVIRSTAGGISESDVLLATASQAIIYGFNVRPDAKV